MSVDASCVFFRFTTVQHGVVCGVKKNTALYGTCTSIVPYLVSLDACFYRAQTTMNSPASTNTIDFRLPKATGKTEASWTSDRIAVQVIVQPFGEVKGAWN